MNLKDVKIIAFVGMPGAGKSLATELFKDKGLPNVYFGGITIGEVKARGLDVNEANEKIVREDIRKNEGLDAYAKRSIPYINDYLKDNDKVVADGIYSFSEYKTLKKEYGNQLLVVAIVAPRIDRYTRLESRPERPLTRQETESRDYAEIENLEKGGPIAIADLTINNNETTEAFIDKLEQLYSSL